MSREGFSFTRSRVYRSLPAYMCVCVCRSVYLDVTILQRLMTIMICYDRRKPEAPEGKNTNHKSNNSNRNINIQAGKSSARVHERPRSRAVTTDVLRRGVGGLSVCVCVWVCGCVCPHVID